jgi:hypothetical protein
VLKRPKFALSGIGLWVAVIVFLAVTEVADYRFALLLLIEPLILGTVFVAGRLLHRRRAMGEEPDTE